MISSFGSGNTVIKSKLITRRMFILSTAKAIVFFGIFGNFYNQELYLIDFSMKVYKP